MVCLQSEAEAKRFRTELVERLARFSLEVEPSKTKVIAFGPWAAARAKAHGRGKPETFDFLGFTHYCGRSRDGRRFRMKRVTARKRIRAKLAALKAWLKSIRSSIKTREVWRVFCAKLRGHFAYYGVTDNSRGLARFLLEAKRLLRKWFNRRGGRRRLTWAKFELMAKRFPLPKPRITVTLLPVW